jgi:fatty acid desaturase
MATLALPSGPRALNDAKLQRCINQLRPLDNSTNWLYLAREYLFLALALTGTVAFYQYRAAWGLAWAWNIPVTALAWLLVGAQQHRLATLGHEAVHYVLFRNRFLNELISDWFCMFPLLSTTQYYRPQHLGHHQFVNDPDRDPDLAQMTASGHRFQFPMSHGWFLWHCLGKQLLWPLRLVTYTFVRARYAALGDAAGPYELPGPRSRLLGVVEFGLLLFLLALYTWVGWWGSRTLLALVPVCIEILLAALYVLLPERFFRRVLIRPVVSLRWTGFSRLTHVNLLLAALAWIHHQTGAMAIFYYFVLWLVPLGTTFSLFMILRQVVQHENADGQRLTNTRIFHVGWWIRFAVFPLGMDYHLPHHLFPMIPHYRLRRLHALLLTSEDYRQHATVAEGYFLQRRQPFPTVLDLMARDPASP